MARVGVGLLINIQESDALESLTQEEDEFNGNKNMSADLSQDNMVGEDMIGLFLMLKQELLYVDDASQGWQASSRV